MTGSRNSRGPVNIDADIPLLGEQWLAGVQTHADTEPTRAESLLRVSRSPKRVLRPPKGDEKRIALRVHLNPTVPHERVSQYAPVLLEKISIRIAQLVQQPCRPLHVGEEERDCPRGKIAPHRVMMRDSAVYVTGTSRLCTSAQLIGAYELQVRRHGSTWNGMERSGRNQRRPPTMA
jgi:hypothetical protein